MGNVSSQPQPVEAVDRSSWLARTRLAHLLVGDRSEAEDIVQHVFMTAVARWDAVEEPAAYLRGAVVNRANDTHRRSFRDAAVPVGDSRAIEEPEMLNRVEASDLGVVEARVREERAVGE